MKYLFVVYLLMSGVWERGDNIEGWGSITYESKEICEKSKVRAEEIHADLMIKNPRAYEKRFECEPKDKKLK